MVSTDLIFSGNTGNSGLGGASGTSTQSGNATQTVFTIAHGLTGATPPKAFIEIKSNDALGTPVITTDTTNITLTYPMAPASGTNNLTWFWVAFS